jgi:hypothetical protein
MTGLSLYDLVIIITGLAVLNGFIVYLLLYVFLNRRYSRGLKSPSRLKEDVVMCGMEYDEEELSAPVSRVFVDIIKRSLPRFTRIIEEGGGTRILNNWFTWMLILLFIVVVLAIIYG